MDTINDRIRYLIDSENLNKTKFAERVGLSQAYVSQICGGIRTPSDRLVADICREFHIRREWLETGEEPMKLPEPDHDMAVIDQLLENEADPVVRKVKRWMSGYFRLSPERRKIAAALLDEIERLQDEK